MKKLLLALAFAGGSLFAQNLTGTWQGALQVPQAPGGQLRVVVKVSTTEKDSLQAVFYSIDQIAQGAQPAKANAVSFQSSNVKISIVPMAATFEGKMSADGNTISGTWSQGPAPLPLTLTRATTETAWAIPDPPPPPKFLPADANPSFEVAVIKPSKPGAPGKGLGVNPRSGQFRTLNMSLADLIAFAYKVHPRQISGAPSWIESERYDIEAKPDMPGQPNDRQVRGMLQKLLVDRFQLTIHHDKKELTAYTINVAKGGPKLTKSEGNPNQLPGLGLRGLGRAVIRNATISDFASTFLQTIVLDRPVVDQTGLTERYDFTLDWTVDETQFPDRQGLPVAPADPNAETFPDLFTAFQQQLGLKLESAKLPVDALVVDKVEKPSEN
ncbi:MAG TPA: TIGR03435 family protein [Bryobacteraceae bacterium]|nr:TIGR03435 family protein [Bryobacteraceae bacterium]